jgi:hypothetical protein
MVVLWCKLLLIAFSVLKGTPNSIDDLKLEMAYALCEELRGAQALKFQLFFGHVTYTYVSKF